MKIAILIGVSDYKTQDNLIASKKDVFLMRAILTAGGLYDSILFIDDQTNTQEVKRKLTEFIKDNIGNEIDELFFYFSGHGYFNGSEFHYVMSDFEAKRMKATSLENSELDVMIKSLSPSLTIKIVDACNSGVPYIKDPLALEKYIDSSKQGFDRCYFMHSSGGTQSSYADNNLSYFTRAIGEAVLNVSSDKIRYKDIIDYVSDKFDGNDGQTPIFINQAPFTEVFLNIRPDFKKEIEQLLLNYSPEVEMAFGSKKLSLKELIEQDARRYFTKERAMVVYNEISNLILSKFTLSGELKDLFDLQVMKHSNYNMMPNPKMIAGWVNKNNDELFVKVILGRENVTRKVRKVNSFSALTIQAMGYSDEDNYRLVNETVSVPVSIEATTDVDYNVMEVFAKSKYPNLNSMVMYILPLLSRTKVVIFSTVAHYKSSDWDAESLVAESSKWVTKNIELCKTEELAEHISELVTSFEDSIITPLMDTFSPLNSQSHESTENS
ncbi:caspase family protein [Serratia sp. 14-2641]|uniref:caspase family protein n=1 Tax=Serratia sp. 14-2641 TaxID=1841657 RepID=UPI0008101604|nr:caspase family protein [Serratia sp. 14-2641]OCJ24623.1 hypothetical protein A6U95_10950 [Serratia sp. 14-2641]